MRKENIPLKNMRGTLILLIMAFHCFSAYIVSQPSHPIPFDRAPYQWLAFPIIDANRWIGFDLFCAFQFLYLMQLMFFLSALFVWPSLSRMGWRAFLGHRLFRLGVPFVLGTYLLMPLAFYPVYRVTAVDQGWSAFWSHWMALPITPTGPMWFLWFLIALNVFAAVLYQRWPTARQFLAALCGRIMDRPGKAFVLVVCVTAAAYLPIASVYSPWQWVGSGPFDIQPSLAPQYVLYFLFGLVAGAYGHERGLLDVRGRLARHWMRWAIGGLASFLIWIVPTALLAQDPAASAALRVFLLVVGDLGLTIFAAAACFGMTALFLRFASTRWIIVDAVAENAYGIYFYHYLFVLWLQFALLDVDLPAIAKGLIVLVGTGSLSGLASVATNRAIAGARLGLERSVKLLAPSPRGR